MSARQARQDEIPFLTEQLWKTTHEKVDLSRCMVWVAEDDNGQLVGMLPFRLIWQGEPLHIFPNTKLSTARRASYELAAEAEAWIADRSKNTTGIYSYFAVIKDKVFEALAKRWGLLSVYGECRIYGRDL